MTIRFRSMVAPVEKMTADNRVLAATGGTTRNLPLPWLAKFETGNGHSGAVVVAKIEKLEQSGDGPNWWAEGHYLDPKIVPEVARAVYLAKEGVHNPSVDLTPSFTVETRPHPTLPPPRQSARFTNYTIAGVTQLPIAAFGEVRIFCTDEEEKAILASVGVVDFDDEWTVFTVQDSAWRRFPLAPREYKYDADDAIQRIAAWSGIGGPHPDLNKYASAFLWRDGSQAGDTFAQDSFRLPVIDVINGAPHLIYHAVYAAAALVSGAHGGLPNVPDDDKRRIAGVINDIYAKMAQTYQDPQMRSPFQQPAQEVTQAAMDIKDLVETVDAFAEFAGKLDKSKEPYGDVTYADPGYQADGKKRYPLDSEEHCRAAWSYINQEKNASEYTPEQLKAIKGRIVKALKKYGVDADAGSEGSESGYDREDKEMALSEELPALLASVAPLAPPRAWFDNPQLDKPTPLTVTEEGRVFGHLAEWRKCHVGIGDACVMAPRTKTGYSHFHLGPVVCDDGSEVRVGKITLGTGHAHPQWGMMPARDHYDNSGWAAALIHAGEDKFGIWVSGSLTTNMSPDRVAELRRSPLSGDWRVVDGNFELIAALAVNSPGFPVLHMQDGKDFSMVGVGVIESEFADWSDDELADFSLTASAVPPTGIEFAEEEDLDEDAIGRQVRWDIITGTADELAQERRAQRFAAITDPAVQPEQGGGVNPMSSASGTDANALAMQLDAFFQILENANDESDDQDPGHQPGQPAQPGYPQQQPMAQPGAAPAPMGAPAAQPIAQTG
jgi:hypothetical protein